MLFEGATGFAAVDGAVDFGPALRPVVLVLFDVLAVFKDKLVGAVCLDRAIVAAAAAAAADVIAEPVFDLFCEIRRAGVLVAGCAVGAGFLLLVVGCDAAAGVTGANTAGVDFESVAAAAIGCWDAVTVVVLLRRDVDCSCDDDESESELDELLSDPLELPLVDEEPELEPELESELVVDCTPI